jgi:hypothetical protein
MSCAPHKLAVMMTDAGWDIQAAMHDRGLDVLDPENAGLRRHLFIAQEQEEPYALSVVEITPDVMTMGRKKLQHAIDIWCSCMRNNIWPGYPAEIQRPEYPSFAEAQWLDREIKSTAKNRIPHDMMMAG